MKVKKHFCLMSLWGENIVLSLISEDTAEVLITPLMLNILGVIFNKLQTSQTLSVETSHITVYFSYYLLFALVFTSIKF